MENSQLTSSVWRRNLKALTLTCPQLASRLCEPVENKHVEVVWTGRGFPSAKLVYCPPVWLHCPEDPVGEARRAVSKWLDCHRGMGGPLLVLGIGLGYELKALLERLDGRYPILAYERDPWLLRLALVYQDLSRDIGSGRLKLLMASDILDMPHGNSLIFEHPVLGKLYKEEGLFLRSRRNVSNSRRAMVAEGGLFVRDVADALREHGFDTFMWNPRNVSERETYHQINEIVPDFVFSINYIHGLPQLCEQLGVQCIVWEIDPTIERLPFQRRGVSTTRVYTYRKARVSTFISAGFKHVEYLPLATNPRRRKPVQLVAEDRNRYGSEISFVGDSMVEQSKHLLHLFTSLCQKSGIPSPDGICRRYIRVQGSRLDADMSAQVLSDAIPRRLLENGLVDSNGRVVDPQLCLGEWGASRRRLEVLSHLVESGYKVSVWGDEGWKHGNLEDAYRGWAGHGEELTKIYNASLINLDINRLYQRDIVTMRVFDVLACKGFILTDSSGDIHQLFNVGHEIIVYDSPDDLLRKVDHFLTDEKEREDIAEAGYRRVLRDHTIEKRISWILQDVT